MGRWKWKRKWKRKWGGWLLQGQHVKDPTSTSGGVVGLEAEAWHEGDLLSKCWKLPAALGVLPGGDAGRPDAAAARVGPGAGVSAPPVESGGSGREGVVGQRSIPWAPAPAAAPAVPGNHTGRPPIFQSWS